MLAAGLTLGCGIQVKPTILFDMLAFLAGFFILTTRRAADLVPRLRATWRQLAALGAVALLPTLAVILLYAATGHLSEWATANIGGQRGFVDDPGQRIEWLAAFWAVLEQAPLWLGAFLAALLAARLLRDAAEARSLAFLLVWMAALCALQLFLRIAADHYFLQFLPPLCLLAGLFLGRTLLAAAATRAFRAGLLATVLALTLFAVAKNPFANGAYAAAKRYLDGHAWAADAPRRVAARVNALKRPGDALYQVGFLPVVYHLTGTLPQIPTRFAFTGLPHPTYAGRDGCPWVPPEAEMRHILDTRPRFVVIEDGVFYKKLEAPVRALLDDRLASDYRLVVHIPDHWIHHSYPLEHFVMNAAAGAWLYVLKDDPGAAPG
jgi:4-amino-4-deoxy-L-arabinose transferase-like glycosyltransferase